MQYLPSHVTRHSSRPIMHGLDSFLVGAMGAAIKTAPGLHTVANDFAAAMLALWRQRMDRALETIKIMRDSRYHDLQRFIIFISTNFASVHKYSFLSIPTKRPYGGLRGLVKAFGSLGSCGYMP